MRRFPAGTQAFLSRPMDMESLDERIRKLPTGKAPGRDGIPYEFFKYGPLEMRNYLLAAANAFMSGSHPLPMVGRPGHLDTEDGRRHDDEEVPAHREPFHELQTLCR